MQFAGAAGVPTTGAAGPIGIEASILNEENVCCAAAIQADEHFIIILRARWTVTFTVGSLVNIFFVLFKWAAGAGVIVIKLGNISV